MAVFGRMSIRPILPEAPLVFARQWADSLTCTRATHLRTEHFGLRRLYCEFYRTWHRLADPQRGLRLLHEPSARSFPAPRTLRPMLPNPPFLQGQAESLCYDQVIMADFGEDSRGFRQVSALLRYLLETGQRVATQIIDWHSIHFIGQKLDSQRHARLLLEFLLGQIQYGSPRVQIFNIQYTTF